jgi:tRNA-dihydrouridine synthase A
MLFLVENPSPVYDKKRVMNQERIIKSTQIPEISVAPMMDWTDRHCRYFHRLISPNTKLYTEMVTTSALLHGDVDRHLRFDKAEHPIALQLGGSDPAALAECARMGEQYGYDEINLNCGCPSDRVQTGRFGACLMKEPDHVAECISAMNTAVRVPVTVKCRIGIDDQDDFAFLDEFVGKIADKGCTTFIIHARKAWLKGLSPKENRSKPPINYDRVAELKAKYPHLRIIVNGEVTTLAQVQTLSTSFDGVMIGREAYSNPFILAEIEKNIFNNNNLMTREEIAAAMIFYAQKQNQEFGTPVKSITRHILGLYHQEKGARNWRRTLSTLPYIEGSGPEVIEKALLSMK